MNQIINAKFGKQADTLSTNISTPYSRENAQSIYEKALLFYKRKHEQDFVLNNQSLLTASANFAIDYFSSQGNKIQNIYQCSGYPVLKFKDKDDDEVLCLILSKYNFQLMHGISIANLRCEMPVTTIMNEFFNFVNSRKCKGTILLLSFFDEKPSQSICEHNIVISTFGPMFVDQPIYINLGSLTNEQIEISTIESKS